MDFSALVPDLERYGAPLIANLLTTAAYAAGGPLVGAAVGTVLKAVASALGAPSASPADIGAAIAADPAKAQAALPKVEAEHAALIGAAADQAHLDEQNLENARAQEVELVKERSALAWAAPAVSVIAVSGFVVVSAFVLSGHGGDSLGGQQILGAMTVGWTTVLTYWLGSSKGSADKTDALMSLAGKAVAGKAEPPRPARRG